MLLWLPSGRVMQLTKFPFTLRQLQYVVAVAKHLSFHKASQACHVSQPSLSTQIAQMEDVLGVPLFERDRRRVLVTPTGQKIVERAQYILRESEDLVECARRAADPFSGTLRIGVIPTISPYLLPRLAGAFRQAYPQLTVRWTEDKTEVLIERLDNGTLDAALLALEADIGDVEYDWVGDDPFVLATSKGHPLGSKKAAACQEELDHEDVLLLDDGHCFRDQALAVCANARAHELEFRATSLSTLAQMVAAGSGVTLLPQLAVDTETKRADLCIRQFKQPAPKRTLALVRRRGSPLAPALKQLAETAKQAYSATPP